MPIAARQPDLDAQTSLQPLKLALRMALPLATLDQDLRNAGQAPAWLCWVRNSPGGTPNSMWQHKL